MNRLSLPMSARRAGVHARGSTTLAEPDQALRGYLQALLDEIPQTSTTQIRQASAPARHDAAARQAPLRLSRQHSTASLDETAMQAPSWGSGAFQALEFKAAGIALAVPLIGLSSIVRLTGRLTQMPGLPPWHLGIQRVRGHQVGVIDLARLLLSAGVTISSTPHNYVLILDNPVWGLACTDLGDAFRIETGAVCWRRTQRHSPLIRGVLTDRLLPLLDGTDILAALGIKVTR